jgi:hypothetical protein
MSTRFLLKINTLYYRTVTPVIALTMWIAPRSKITEMFSHPMGNEPIRNQNRMIINYSYLRISRPKRTLSKQYT